MSSESALAILIALVLSAALTPALRPWLIRRRILDWPDARRSHEHPTPRGGGLAIWLGIVLGLTVAAGPALPVLLIIIFATVLALLGWLDDSRGVRISLRLLVMVAAALGLAVIYGPVGSIELLGVELHAPWLWSALGVVAVVWMINLHNFMDGSDGLAAMQTIWSAGLLGVLLYRGGEAEIGLAGLAVAGACLGFLLWNRPPASIFMGDVGSLMLGGMIGMLAYVGVASGLISVWLCLIVCAVFVVDATATLLLRGLSEGQWYTAHREHAYQRLIQAGLTHAQVLLLYGTLNLILVLPALILGMARPSWQMPLALVLIAVLVGFWAVVQKQTR